MKSDLFNTSFKFLFWLGVVSISIFALFRITNLQMNEILNTEKPINDQITNTTFFPSKTHINPTEYINLLQNNNSNDKYTESIPYITKLNPYNGKNFVELSKFYEASGQQILAHSAIEIACVMSPQRQDVQADAAAFFFKNGDLFRAFKHLDFVLSKDSSTFKSLFPVILTAYENHETKEAVSKQLDPSKPWVSSFSVYAINNSQNNQTINELLDLYHIKDEPLAKPVIDSYINRLQKQGLWLNAYFTWIDSLSKNQLNEVGNLYNGGFEKPFTNHGFDWIEIKSKGVHIDVAPKASSEGGYALRLNFLGQRTPFKHLFQKTVLSPGSYVFSGKVMLEDLQAFKGLRWSVSCIGSGAMLGSSDNFKGKGGWRGFDTTITVPSLGCPAQLVRLELVGKVALDFEATGTAWFDDLRIDKVVD